MHPSPPISSTTCLRKPRILISVCFSSASFLRHVNSDYYNNQCGGILIKMVEFLIKMVEFTQEMVEFTHEMVEFHQRFLCKHHKFHHSTIPLALFKFFYLNISHVDIIIILLSFFRFLGFTSAPLIVTVKVVEKLFRII